MDHNYYNTVIVAASDSPVSESTVPQPRGKKETVAEVQYKMLAGHPFEYTQEDVLFNSWFQRQELGEPSEDEVAELREQFFSKPQPCLRTSPLAKKYGWGFIFDDEGRVTLTPVESDEYRQAVDSGEFKVLTAMRSSRG